MIMRNKLWIALAVLVAAAGLVAVVVIGGGDKPAPEPQQEDDEPATLPVTVIDPLESTMADTRSYTATVQPWEIAHISGISGTIIDSIHVREGDRVNQGQLVAEMYDSDLRQAQVELRTARAELERTERLVEVGSVAGQQFEQVQAQYETAENTVEMLRKNTRLTSPIDGVVTDKYFVAGEQFAASAETPAVVTVQQIDPLKVTVDVSERHFRAVTPDMEVSLRLDAHGSRQFDAVVDRIHPTVNPDSRTFRVDVRLDNPDGEISPGMSGRVTMELGEVTGIFVPRSALKSEPGSDRHFAYVVDDTDTARRVDVEVGERINQYRRVIDGIDTDDRVILEGTRQLIDGTPVRIVD